MRTKFTRRVTKLNDNSLSKLRASSLKSARTAEERKFIRSDKFRLQLNRNIRSNRVQQNIKRIDSIVNKLGGSMEQKRSLKNILGERTTVNKYGRKINVNSFTTKRQTERLARIEKSIKLENFKIKRYVSRNRTYTQAKEILPSSADTFEILTAMSRSDYYYQNRETILEYNKQVSKLGYEKAKREKLGRKLSKSYSIDRNKESKDLALLLAEDL